MGFDDRVLTVPHIGAGKHPSFGLVGFTAVAASRTKRLFVRLALPSGFLGSQTKPGSEILWEAL